MYVGLFVYLLAFEARDCTRSLSQHGWCVCGDTVSSSVERARRGARELSRAGRGTHENDKLRHHHQVILTRIEIQSVLNSHP